MGDFEFKNSYDMKELLDIMRILRGPGGCPGDAEQTHESIKKDLIEETYEVIEAINKNDKELLCEELGDLLMQVVFHAQMEKEKGEFEFGDVTDGICKKLSLAIEKTGCERLVLAGGVAANSHLRNGIKRLCEKKGVKLYMPPLSLCGDNGAMVGAQAYFEYLAGIRAGTDLNAFASGEGAEAAKAVGRL